ncbi:hypothetical protein [Bdellovibrio sp. NC01]|uniref:hypothetical protein n=1 Tax=Bdellovibrio sp. NC01 TaxID=2220073 RepID=UPI00115BB413|nr:hypothetical protein [Bdellovibrio sp. NC01]QDK38534.1 hypothetical protein DOE51_13585 [Bdellovibrio sp. NC01]
MPFLAGCSISTNIESALLPSESKFYGVDGTLNSVPTVKVGDSTSNFTVTGVCHPDGSQIEIRSEDGQTVLGSAVCGSSQFTANLDLQSSTQGPHNLKITTTDTTGAKQTNTSTLFVDTIAPALSLSQDLPGGSLNATAVASLPLQGACTTGDQDVEIDGAGLHLTAACVNDHWSTTLDATSVADGVLHFTAKQVDSVGNTTTVALTAIEKDTLPPNMITLPTMTATISPDPSIRNVALNIPADVVAYKILQIKDDTCANQSAALDATSTVNASTTQFNLDPNSGDGVYRICAYGWDAAGNRQTIVTQSPTLTIDTVPPALTLTSPANNSSWQSVVTLTGACEIGLAINVSGDFSGSPLSASCSSGSYSLPIALAGADGAKNMTVSQTDAAGNSSNSFLTLNKDNIVAAPAITAVTSSPTKLAVATFTSASCGDIKYILVNETGSVPSVSDPAWQTCATTVGAISYDLSTAGTQGPRSLKFFAKDAAGNISTATTLSIVYDTLVPALTILPIPNLQANGSYTLRWSITEQYILSTSAMQLEYTTNGGTSWTSIASVPVSEDYPATTKSYSYNWTVPTAAAAVQVRVRLTDLAGNAGSTTSNTFAILTDITAPTISLLKVDGVSSPRTSPFTYGKVNLTANDGQTAVTQFCLKIDSAAPASNHTCWINVNAPVPGLPVQANLTLTNYATLITQVPGTVTLYAWVKDMAGNISVNSGTVNVDSFVYTYTPDAPPSASEFLAFNQNTVPNPVLPAHTTVATGGAIYLNWKATDNGSIADVTLLKSEDGINFTPVVTGLQNTTNGTACTKVTNDSSHGCYIWNSDVADGIYFKLQLQVTDNLGQSATTVSLPMNASNFAVMAGNMDSGYNGNGKKTVMLPYEYNTPTPGQFVVSSDGKIVVLDSINGLVYFDPETNNSSLLLKMDTYGTPSGHNVDVHQARAGKIYAIAIDFMDRVIVQEEKVIRRIDLRSSPMTIENIIGADSSFAYGTDDSANVADPRNLKFNFGLNDKLDFGNSFVLQALPNGDIYFSSEKERSTPTAGRTIRIYKGSSPTPYIATVTPGGSGATNIDNTFDTSYDLNAYPYRMTLEFNPNTSAISRVVMFSQKSIPGDTWSYPTYLNTGTFQGLGSGPTMPSPVNTSDGNPHRSNIYRTASALNGNTYILYNYANMWVGIRHLKSDGTWETMLGSGDRGFCADGTVATSCDTSVNDVFVNRLGQIYFLDTGRIRTIFNGKVYTIYGADRTTGDGGLVGDMHMGNVYYMDHGLNNGVIISDFTGLRLREIRPGQSPEVRTIAGNGRLDGVNTAVAATATSIDTSAWGSSAPIATDPATGDVYSTVGYTISKLSRGTGMWSTVISAGGAAASDSFTHGNLAFTDFKSAWGVGVTPWGYQPTAAGFFGGYLYTHHLFWGGTEHVNSTLRKNNLGTTTSAFFVGYIGSDQSGCPNLSPVGSCAFRYAGVNAGIQPTSYSPIASAMLIPGQTIVPNPDGGTMNLDDRLHVVSGATAYTLMRLAQPALAILEVGGNIYYCGKNDTKLYKVTIPGALQTATGSWPLTAGVNGVTEAAVAFPHSSYRCGGSRMLFKAASGGLPDRIVFIGSQYGVNGLMVYYLP